MKKILFVLLTMLFTSAFAQEVEEKQAASVWAKPSNGKSMVYITRREPAAVLIKFGIYDGDIFLGKLGAKKYFAYECDPGEHIFMAKGENTFYVEANLEEGKVYVLDLKVQMGIASARLKLVPFEKSNKKYEKEKSKISKFISKSKGEILSEENDIEEEDDGEDDGEAEVQDPTTTRSKRLQKFYKMKEKGKKITSLTSDMYVE